MIGRRALRGVALVALLVAGVMLAACEKPDRSFQTSPSAKALVGTTRGNVAVSPVEPLPAAVEPPEGWEIAFNLALFDKLENGTQSLRILMTIQTKPGLGMELWLSNETGTVARWSGGSTGRYDGVACWQMKLREGGESLTLPAGSYTATVVFRDVERGVVAAKALKVTGNVPTLTGSAPSEGSAVFRDLLGCPRGS